MYVLAYAPFTINCFIKSHLEITQIQIFSDATLATQKIFDGLPHPSQIASILFQENLQKIFTRSNSIHFASGHGYTGKYYKDFVKANRMTYPSCTDPPPHSSPSLHSHDHILKECPQYKTEREVLEGLFPCLTAPKQPIQYIFKDDAIPPSPSVLPHEVRSLFKGPCPSKIGATMRWVCSLALLWLRPAHRRGGYEQHQLNQALKYGATDNPQILLFTHSFGLGQTILSCCCIPGGGAPPSQHASTLIWDLTLWQYWTLLLGKSAQFSLPTDLTFLPYFSFEH